MPLTFTSPQEQQRRYVSQFLNPNVGGVPPTDVGQTADTILNLLPKITRTEPKAPPPGDLISTFLRVAPAIAGGAGGAVLGAAGGPLALATASAGGALGSGLGEYLAQMYEQSQGMRDEYNLTQMAMQTGLGAIPLGMGKGMTAGKFALQGMGLGAAGAAGTEWAETGEAPSWETIAAGGVLGGGMGYGLGKFATRVGKGQQGKPTMTPEVLRELKDAREAAAKGMPVRLSQAAEKAKIDFIDSRMPLRKWIGERIGEAKANDPKLAKSWTQEDDPTEMLDLLHGILKGDQSLDVSDIDKIRKAAQEELGTGIDADLTQYLDLQGFKNVVGRMDQKIVDEIAEGDLSAVGKLLDKISREPESFMTGGTGKFGPKGLPRDIKNRASFLDISEKEADAALDELATAWGPERLGRITEYADKIWKYNEDSLKMLQTEGIITTEVFERIHKLGYEGKGGYVPMLRIMDALADGASKKAGRAAITHSDAVGLKKTPKSLMPFKGSPRPMHDPVQASLARRLAVREDVQANRSAKEFLKWRGLHKEFADSMPEITDDINKGVLTESKLNMLADDMAPNGYTKITLMDDGKARHFKMPKEIGDAMKLLNQENASVLGEVILKSVGGLTKRLATGANIGFGLIANPERDVYSALTLSGAVRNPGELIGFVDEYVRTLIPALKRVYFDPTTKVRGREEALKEGVLGMAALTDALNPQRAYTGAATRNKADKFLAHFEKGTSVLEEHAKLTTRNFMNQPKKMTLRGYKTDLPDYINPATGKAFTPREKALHIRRFGGSPDYLVKGSKAHTTGHIILFFNAQVQGSMQALRGIKNMSNTKKAVVLGGITAGELARHQYNNQFVDSDGMRSIDRVADSNKEDSWVWMSSETYVDDNGITRHKVIRRNKPHWMRLISNPISQVIGQTYSKSEHSKETSAGQMLVDTVTRLAPGSFNIDINKPMLPTAPTKPGELGKGVMASLNPAIKVLAEYATNTTGYTGAPQVPRRLENVAPSEQFTERSSPALVAATRLLARAGLELSPMRIEKGIQGAIPGFGETGFAIADTAAAAVARIRGETPTGDDPERRLGSVADIFHPIERRIYGSERDQYQQDQLEMFYRVRDEAVTAKASYDKMLEEVVSEADYQNAQDYREENLDLINAAKYLNQIGRKMGELRPFDRADSYLTRRGLLESGLQDIDARGLEGPEIKRLYEEYKLRSLYPDQLSGSQPEIAQPEVVPPPQVMNQVPPEPAMAQVPPEPEWLGRLLQPQESQPPQPLREAPPQPREGMPMADLQKLFSQPSQETAQVPEVDVPEVDGSALGDAHLGTVIHKHIPGIEPGGRTEGAMMSLLRAVADTETNPSLTEEERSAQTSPVGAEGLFQFMPKQATLDIQEMWPEFNPRNPHHAAEGAMMYFDLLAGKFGPEFTIYDIDSMLAGYNHGAGALLRAEGKFAQGSGDKTELPEETRNYITDIKKLLGPENIKIINGWIQRSQRRSSSTRGREMVEVTGN